MERDTLGFRNNHFNHATKERGKVGGIIIFVLTLLTSASCVCLCQ